MEEHVAVSDPLEDPPPLTDLSASSSVAPEPEHGSG